MAVDGAGATTFATFVVDGTEGDKPSAGLSGTDAVGALEVADCCTCTFAFVEDLPKGGVDGGGRFGSHAQGATKEDLGPAESFTTLQVHRLFVEALDASLASTSSAADNAATDSTSANGSASSDSSASDWASPNSHTNGSSDNGFTSDNGFVTSWLRSSFRCTIFGSAILGRIFLLRIFSRLGCCATIDGCGNRVTFAWLYRNWSGSSFDARLGSFCNPRLGFANAWCGCCLGREGPDIFALLVSGVASHAKEANTCEEDAYEGPNEEAFDAPASSIGIELIFVKEELVA